MWELDCGEIWVLRNWCFWTVALKALESPLDCKKIQLVHPKGDQSWVFIGRTDVEAETPILWPLYAKSWLIGKDPGAGKGWGQEEKGTTEDEMAGWHHCLDGGVSECILGDGDGQGGVACCDSWGRKESDTTEQLNWTEGWSSGLFKFPIQWDLCWVFFICLFFLWWARLSDGIILSADDWVCIFVLFFRWGLGDAWSCIQVVSFVWVLTIWYSLGLVLW